MEALQLTMAALVPSYTSYSGNSAQHAPSLVLHPAAARHTLPQLQQVRTSKSSEAFAEHAARAAAVSMSPVEYEAATRTAARTYLESNGPHASPAAPGIGVQRAEFLQRLWGVDALPVVPECVAEEPGRVLATVYEIGGPLTAVLSKAVAKELPLIPHLGIRVHGVEYFYSDHVERRSVPVMEQMLGGMPQITLDLGQSCLSPSEMDAEIARLQSRWTADEYHVFDQNCVHFAIELAELCCASPVGYPQPLAQGLIDVSERALDSLPQWRVDLGRRLMNDITRLVVVSWAKASKAKKEKLADNLGLTGDA